MSINKALIVADPWIGLLLNGTKTWEMRSSGASHRGWFGLIRKGTGAVYGVARLIDVGTPLTPTEMIANINHHRIPERMIRSGEVAKWNTPWKLADVRCLPNPVPYLHKSGAVTWIELDPEAIEGIVTQVPEASDAIATSLSSVRPMAKAARQAPNAEGAAVNINQRGRKQFIDSAEQPIMESATASRLEPPITPRSSAQKIGELEITAGNIANNHIYLRPLLNHLPADAVGGSNRSSAASRQLIINWGGPNDVLTDIDGQKKIFRARGWIGEFYKINRVSAGDKVVVELTSPYCIRLRVNKLDRKHA